MTAPAPRQVVLWSGGLDSTLILDRVAEHSERARPVLALTVDVHPQLDNHQLLAQRRAQRAYLRHADKKKLFIEHVSIAVKVTGPTSVGVSGQSYLWLATVLPYVQARDQVHLGYIRYDDFWHSKEKFERAFAAFCKMTGARDATLFYDLEWEHKADVLRELLTRGIGPELVWTCDNPRRDGSKVLACQECSKCRAWDTAVTTEKAAAEERARRRAQIKKAHAAGKTVTSRTFFPVPANRLDQIIERAPQDAGLVKHLKEILAGDSEGKSKAPRKAKGDPFKRSKDRTATKARASRKVRSRPAP